MSQFHVELSESESADNCNSIKGLMGSIPKEVQEQMEASRDTSQ